MPQIQSYCSFLPFLPIGANSKNAGQVVFSMGFMNIRVFLNHGYILTTQFLCIKTKSNVLMYTYLTF